MKKFIRLVASALLLASVANAGVLVDVKFGTGSQLDVKPSGNVDGFSMDSQLGLDSSAQTNTYFEFEHPIPLVPNIKYEINTLSFTGTATQSFTAGGVTYTANAASNFSWDHNDAILYWGIPFSTWVPMIDAVDFGLGAKLGKMKMGITGVSQQEFDFGAVYGYGRVHVSPPMFFGIGIEIEMKSLSTTQNSTSLTFNETIYKLDWMAEAPIPVIDLAIGLEAGIRSMDYKLNVGGSNFDLGFSGMFFNVVGQFGI